MKFLPLCHIKFDAKFFLGYKFITGKLARDDDESGKIAN